MKKNIFSKVITLLLLVGMSACIDIDDLSDYNTVTSFKINKYAPQEITIGEIEITEENFIYIPVRYGIDKFPLVFSAELAFGGAIDRVLGLDFSKPLTLEGMDKPLTFTVVAKSGLPRKYTIIAKPVDFLSQKEIPFELISNSSATTLVYEKAFITDDILTIYAIDPEYPITLVPKFETSELIDFDRFVNGETAFTFNSAESLNNLIIVDKINNSSKDFIVRLQKLEEGRSDDMDIYNSDFEAAMLGNVGVMDYKGHRVDNEKDTILLYANNLEGQSGFPVTFTLDLGELSSDDVSALGFKSEITFDNYDEAAFFYLINVEKGMCRKWHVAVAELDIPELPTAADVIGFAFDYDAYRIVLSGNRPCITLDRTDVEIYPENGEIYLKATEINSVTSILANLWNLTLKDLSIQLSDGATCGTPTLRWNGSNTAWQETKTFNVTSAKGTVKTWKVIIKDYRSYTSSTACDITGVSFVSIMPPAARESSTVLNTSDKTITIHLKEDDGAYPLSVQLAYTLSPFAKITSQTNNSQPLVFNSPTSEAIVTVLAEDGVTSQDYTVKLVPPVNTTEPNVTSFSVTSSLPPQFGLFNVNISTELGEIVLSPNDVGSCPLTINYKMDIARKAASTLPLSGSLVFSNLAEQKKFTVTSVDNSTKEWTIRIVSTSQLKNWTLENWSGNDPLPKGSSSAPYWATANTTGLVTMTGTTRTTGTSGYAAKLSTLRAPIVNTLASASMFLGWFDSSDVISGMNDPVKLTFQGIPFSASKKIIGLEVDVNYSSAGSGDDTGSIAIELIKNNNTSGSYVYHGNKPDGTAHPNNTAIVVAEKRVLLGNKAATVNGEIVHVIGNNTWKTIQIPLDYSKMNNVFDYTHLLVMAASSSQGDLFVGDVGSTLMIDNIKLIYEN